jgi:hypothetical protein
MSLEADLWKLCYFVYEIDGSNEKKYSEIQQKKTNHSMEPSSDIPNDSDSVTDCF